MPPDTHPDPKIIYQDDFGTVTHAVWSGDHARAADLMLDPNAMHIDCTILSPQALMARTAARGIAP